MRLDLGDQALVQLSILSILWSNCDQQLLKQTFLVIHPCIEEGLKVPIRTRHVDTTIETETLNKGRTSGNTYIEKKPNGGI